MKFVPAVTEVSFPQAAHSQPPGDASVPSPCRPQAGQTRRDAGRRRPSGKRASKAARDIGRSSFQRLGMTALGEHPADGNRKPNIVKPGSEGWQKFPVPAKLTLASRSRRPHAGKPGNGRKCSRVQELEFRLTAKRARFSVGWPRHAMKRLLRRGGSGVQSAANLSLRQCLLNRGREFLQFDLKWAGATGHSPVRLPKPHMSCHIVLGDTLPPAYIMQAELGEGNPLLGTFPIPLQSFGVVLDGASAFVVHDAEKKLGISVALLSERKQPHQSRCIVAYYIGSLALVETGRCRGSSR